MIPFFCMFTLAYEKRIGIVVIQELLFFSVKVNLAVLNGFEDEDGPIF